MNDLLIWVPARRGSKRIKGKNLRLVAGASLLARTVWAAREFRRAAGVSARIVIDTDCEEIAREGSLWGGEVPFLREPEFAGDRVTSVDTVLRLLDRLEALGDETPPAVLLLQTTSPLRTIEHMLECWSRFKTGRWDRVLSVRPAGVEYGGALVSDGSGSLTYAGSDEQEGVVCPSGAFYAVTTSALRRDRAFFAEGSSGGVMTHDLSALDVDEPYQLEVVQALGERLPRVTDPCMVIAEAGVNHDGELDRALQLVEVAADAGADAVKFQTFDPDKLVSAQAPKAAYQTENTGVGGTQMEMLRALTLSEENHHTLSVRCAELGIRFMSTPFDEGSATFLVGIGMDILKVPSGEITNWPFLEHVARLGRPLILSTGMSTLAEVADAVAVVRTAGTLDLKLLHCVSDYPTRPADANLRAMGALRAMFGVPVGWSDHTLGITVALAAVALGATVVEKHFTLSRDLPGPDHRASLEPDELKQLVQGIRDTELALGSGEKMPVATELATAKVARRSLHAVRRMEKGEILREQDLVFLRPGVGIPPSELSQVVGRRLLAPLAGGAILTEDILA